MPTRVTQTSKEIAATAIDPAARATQATADILATGAGTQAAKATQATAELLATGAGTQAAKATQATVEILVEARSSLIWMRPTPGPIPEGDVPAPTVALSPPPPIPITYLYPAGGAKVGTFRPKAVEADARLLELQRLWERYTEQWETSLRGMGRISNGTRWLTFGRQRRPFFRQGSVVTPAPSAGDTAVVDFEVPEGYYGWLSGFYWQYTGTGFIEGTDDIEWRIAIGDSHPDGYGAVRFQMGLPTDPVPLTGMMPLRSRDRVRILVLVRNNSGLIQVGSSYILGGLTGWLYEPERTGAGGVKW